MKLKNATFQKIRNIFQLLAIILVFLTIIFLAFLLWTKYTIHNENNNYSLKQDNLVTSLKVQSFPIGVNPEKKEIIEDPLFSAYIESHLLVTNTAKERQVRFFDRLIARLSESNFYQQLASPRSRILVIYPGERKEEIAKNFAKILKWDNEQKQSFVDLVSKAEPELVEGKFFPGRYVVDAKTTPEEIVVSINKKFTEEILNKYNEEISNKVSLNDALIIASLLEREAYDFKDMRQISGIIWNRLFMDMPLQLDATLQYARGNKISETKWWPVPRPADKFIDSPYNTYKNTGLPPAPIANPSVEAVIATLNPEATDCMFYFHDPKGGFHCSKTYEEHVSTLKKIYGQGK